MTINILAIDTSTEVCSVALMINNFIFSKMIMSTGQHNKYILPTINKLFEKTNFNLKDLNLIAFSDGPGSITGIRIGMCIALGIALGENLKFVKIYTLETLAQKAFQNSVKKIVFSAINTRYNEFNLAKYIKKYNGLEKKYEKIISSEELIILVNNIKEKCIYAGSGWYSNLIFNKINIPFFYFKNKEFKFPSAKYMLPIALKMWNQGKILSI